MGNPSGAVVAMRACGSGPSAACVRGGAALVVEAEVARGALGTREKSLGCGTGCVCDCNQMCATGLGGAEALSWRTRWVGET